MEVQYSDRCHGIDWERLKAALAADDFDNGRSPEQLQRSFENSAAVCFAMSAGEVLGTARVLSDGVCNAYLIDVWTASAHRRRGIARQLVERLLAGLSGQHVYLQANREIIEVYRRLGFAEQPVGMSRMVGQWLVNEMSS